VVSMSDAEKSCARCGYYAGGCECGALTTLRADDITTHLANWACSRCDPRACGCVCHYLPTSVGDAA
jgi:hypothetical protein